MREPTPETLSYATDLALIEQIEVCFGELLKRKDGYDAAFMLWDRLGAKLDDAEPKAFRPIPHRQSA